MTKNVSSSAIGAVAEHNIPYLRRYARALTGNQKDGDGLAAATLESLLADRRLYDTEESGKLALFKVFHAIWDATGAQVNVQETGLKKRAQRHLSSLTRRSREALLLTTMEDFSFQESATILNTTPEDVEKLVDKAREQMSEAVSGTVLIIEDEAIIAMDLEAMVLDMGHRIAGVARTRDAATALGRTDPPDLILTDIQLADDSSGVDAVVDILGVIGQRPVVFITAYPERLLTGSKPEPTFLITKPYTEEQVRSAVSQAMFFSSTETLGNPDYTLDRPTSH
ncbi:MAG: response regulator [Paracoccaceae bacterium]